MVLKSIRDVASANFTIGEPLIASRPPDPNPLTLLKLALLKLASQEAARLMAAGEYERALPVALDAVQQGQALFKPSPALQLFPLYLLAAQANLGLRRSKQCEDFLALASWLAMKEPLMTTM